MSDYNLYLRRDGKLIDRFSQMVQNFRDDFEEEIVVVTLLNYYNTCCLGDRDEDLLWAIERVLQDFMTTDEFNGWRTARAMNELAKADVEDALI
jgi:pantothenate synthetase